ncbi:glycosyl transferase [Rhodobacteraceae bacterium WD3A24]|nr:glycosyl transferase [Rhodobacteraceae bacterium WD3A24]
MSLGFLMLCHTALDRAAQVARHWAQQGCPVVIHVDARVGEAALEGMKRALDDCADVRFAPRHRCEWGTWSLVAAMQSAAELMLAAFPDVSRVYAASGSCLPLRPTAELGDWLDARPDTDFIESVTTADVGWTQGGLSLERFTLRFPFAWKRHRWLFDRWVTLQRRLHLQRPIPEGIEPHLGSQWWCLTRETLEAILTDPRRGEFDRYFRTVWIPDESYFQTLARRHARRIESRSLTLSKFDFQGKPHIFYDDHLQLLRRSDCFVARKIWPGADGLYDHFLSLEPGAPGRAEPKPGRIDRLFSQATARRTRGRAGLYMQSRYPREHWENGRTATRYSVFEGFTELFEDFETWLGRAIGARVHGHLYAPDRAHFAGGERLFNGCLSDSAALRDYVPTDFLTNLIWNTRSEHPCFQFGPADNQAPAGFVAADPNARISVITGAWAVPLFRAATPFDEIRARAARLQKTEAEHLGLLRNNWVRAQVRVWPLADFAAAPAEPIQDILDEITPRGQPRLTEMPRMVDLTGFGRFLQTLRNAGMNPWLAGDFPLEDTPQPAPPARRARQAR